LLRSTDILEHFSVLTSHRVVSGLNLALSVDRVGTVETFVGFDGFFFLSTEYSFLNHGEIKASLGPISNAGEPLCLRLAFLLLLRALLRIYLGHDLFSLLKDVRTVDRHAICPFD